MARRAHVHRLVLRPAAVLAGVAMLMLLAVQPASANRSRPPDFFGVWANGTLDAHPFSRAHAMNLQTYMGARHLRQFISWSRVEWRPGQWTYASTDSLVEGAARRGVRVFPVLVGSTDWNTTKPAGQASRGVYPPRDPSGFAAFARKTVERYGEHGRFWRDNPHIPYLPIVSWQVWNEPSIPFFWASGPDPRAYTELLRVTARAIRSADPGAEVVAAGIPNSTLGSPLIAYIREMYRHGAAGSFDVLGVHPYGPDVSSLIATMRSVRREMDAHADPSPIWASEFGWPTGGPRTALTVNEATQAALVENSLRLLSNARVGLNLRAVTYFAWRDTADRDLWTEHTGLARVDGTLKPAFLGFTRIAGGTPLLTPPATDAGRPGEPAPSTPRGGPSAAPGSSSGPAEGEVRSPHGSSRVAIGAQRRVRVTRSGRVPLQVGCWSSGGGSFAGRAVIDSRGHVPRTRMAQREFRARSGAVRTVKPRLSSRARRLLRRRGRLRVRVVVRVRDRDGARSRDTKLIWLFAAR